MPEQIQPTRTRISLAAVQQLDQLARRFRRQLRDVALELSQAEGDSLLTPDTVLRAVPVECRRLLSGHDSSLDDERGPDVPEEEAA
jgi:hypothetical protein